MDTQRNYKTVEFSRKAGVEVEALERIAVQLLGIAHPNSEAPCQWRLDLMRVADELANLIEQRSTIDLELGGRVRSRVTPHRKGRRGPQAHVGTG